MVLLFSIYYVQFLSDGFLPYVTFQFFEVVYDFFFARLPMPRMFKLTNQKEDIYNLYLYFNRNVSYDTF